MKRKKKKTKMLSQVELMNQCRDRSVRPRATVFETKKQKLQRRSNAKNGKFGWRTELMKENSLYY
jgi:hypothetical protein